MNLQKIKSAFAGALAADAISMPVHWYYDRAQLVRECGEIDRFIAPHNPHGGSFMGQSTYQPLNKKADIFHDQAKYLGVPRMHYHPFLKAGENTLNFQLAKELHRLILEKKRYRSDEYLNCYIDCMLKAGWHHDTYIEGCHRQFFQNYARGLAPMDCGVDDEDMGGLAAVPALIAALSEVNSGISIAELRQAVQQNVALTHRNQDVIRAALVLTEIICAISAGAPVREAITEYGSGWLPVLELNSWLKEDDNTVIGERYKPSCPIRQSMPSSLYLAWKYHDDFAAGIAANAMAGGDNCHRGAVVGGILGAANGPLAEKFKTT